jgi:putative membrane protein
MGKTIVFVILAVLILLFVIQNTQVVETRFLVWTISMSRSLLLLGTFIIGVIAGWLLRRPKHRG